MQESKKIALITGANKGLGLETARQLGRKNIHVIITARDKAKGEAALKQLRDEKLSAELMMLDVSSKTDIKRFAEEFRRKHNTLDILINNAGVEQDGGWQGNTVATVSREVLESTFATNFLGTVQLTQELLPLIQKSSAGRIVNLSSVMSSLTIHGVKNGDLWNFKPFAYDASKTALNQFTVHLAQLLDGTNASVVSAHPGWVKTDLGTSYAPMEIADGAKTGVDLALAETTAWNGKFIHLGSELPW